MSRVKTFDSTGQAPSGRLYSGDLNAIQDQYADLVNYAQTHGVGVLAVGDASLQLLKFGAGEMRMTGHVRTDGIVRGLGGLFAGQFTTAERDAIPSGERPYGLLILNSDIDELQWNAGTDGSPEWMPIAMRGDGIHGGGAFIGEDSTLTSDVIAARVVGDTFPRWAAHADGSIAFGDGASLHDSYIRRTAANELELDGRWIGKRAAGQQVFGAKDPADVIHRWWVASDGSMEWGPGAAAARDVRLYRSAADVLKLDDTFEAKGIRTTGEEMNRWGTSGSEFRQFKMVSVTLNPPELNGFTGSGPTNYALPAGTGKAGDHIAYMGVFNDLLRYYTLTVRPTMPLDDRVQITWFNTDNAQRNPGSSTFHFHVWNMMP